MLLVPLFVPFHTSQTVEIFSVLYRTVVLNRASIPDLRLNVITFCLKCTLYTFLNQITCVFNLLQELICGE